MRSKILLMVALFAVLVAAPAHAQTFMLKVNVPYQFSAGGKTFPPGNYQFTESKDAKIIVGDANGKQSFLAILSRLGGSSVFNETSLVFDVSDNSRVLSEVWIPGRSGILVHSTPQDHEHQLLVGSAPGSPKLTGKDTFERTCKRCHGVNGEGDAAADKFFNKTIPRLSSAYVQSKSDAELKETITHGKSDMPAVRLDKPGVGHLLPTESVDSVIAYVRTLKK